MALLNPPELRPSMLLLIAKYLAGQRGQRDQVERLLAALAPVTLGGADPDRDVRLNLQTAIEIGLLARDGDSVGLVDGCVREIRAGELSTMALLRRLVFSDSLNAADWGSQVGARDLTNALSWFLTFGAMDAPSQMEGRERSANALQEADFGPRQPGIGEDDSGGWPIANANRWNSFRRWACSLGFAWALPDGQLVPDPTVAVREALPRIMARQPELTAREFVDALADEVPVVDDGRYRKFVESNWRRTAPGVSRLTPSLTEALERLQDERRLILDDRADAPRLSKADGSTFSHVRHAKR